MKNHRFRQSRLRLVEVRVEDLVEAVNRLEQRIDKTKEGL